MSNKSVFVKQLKYYNYTNCCVSYCSFWKLTLRKLYDGSYLLEICNCFNNRRSCYQETIFWWKINFQLLCTGDTRDATADHHELPRRRGRAGSLHALSGLRTTVGSQKCLHSRRGRGSGRPLLAHAPENPSYGCLGTSMQFLSKFQWHFFLFAEKEKPNLNFIWNISGPQ